jgi:hypothetical protein
MSNINIITGSSQNHFISLKQFLDSVDTSLYCCYVWDLGLHKESAAELKSTYNIKYRLFDYSKYPDYYNIQINAGEYAWKPAIIRSTMEEINNTSTAADTILFWCDAGNILVENSLTQLKDILLTNKLYSPISAGTIKDWTHKKTLEYFSLGPEHPFLDKQNRNGAQLGFLICDNEIKEFVKYYDFCGHTKEFIAPEGSNRSNHRQDQAVFSLLYYRFFQTHPQYSVLDREVCYIHMDKD